MSENQHQQVQSQKESLETFAKIVRDRYGFLYEQMLSGHSSLLVAKIAARWGVTEDVLINEVTAYEADRILKEVEMESSQMKKLKQMVDTMKYCP